MIFANRYSLIIVVIIQFFTTVLAQNTVENQYNLAEELFISENYFDAITEFKRLLFFDNTGKFNYTANRLIGSSYKYVADKNLCDPFSPLNK